MTDNSGRNFMTRAFTWVTVLVAAIALASCARRETPRIYQLRGVVVHLDQTAQVASIKGEKIEGWMEPMTMDYPIPNAEEFRALKEGDEITATVHVTSEKYWLTNVKKRRNRT
ncbi:MAG TPA: copper-binding protein [Bryobacteraceae bacterium]|nr:copper-binding protein [Bryobacteraceae bacterium]